MLLVLQISSFVLFNFVHSEISFESCDDNQQWFPSFKIRGATGSCSDEISSIEVHRNGDDLWYISNNYFFQTDGYCYGWAYPNKDFTMPLDIRINKTDGQPLSFSNIITYYSTSDTFSTGIEWCSNNPTTFTPTTNSPSAAPTQLSSTAPTVTPTVEPTWDDMLYQSTTDSDLTFEPTMFPSQSPTRYPIDSEFESAVTAIFNISGWTHSQISQVNNDWELFISSLTKYIHQGFNDDPVLEFRHIVPGVVLINEYTLDELIHMNKQNMISIMDQIVDNGMQLLYLIECDANFYCIYITRNGQNTQNIQMNHTSFERFVSTKLHTFFVSTNSNSGDDTSGNSLIFMVESMILIEEESLGNVDDDALILNSSLLFIVGLSATACVVIGIALLVVVLCLRKHSKEAKDLKSLSIRNALVVMISIGDYSEGNKILAQDKDVKGIFKDLAVEKDAETVRDLCKYMNWTFVSKDRKIHWTEQEIVSFLQTEIGEMMFTANGSLNHDGLILCISCHGVTDKIVTSDIKTIEKTAIHRILSLKYPKLREIPRMFVFDCCDGSHSRTPTVEIVPDQSKVIKSLLKEGPEQRKNTDCETMQNVNAWTSSTKNPDYNMVTVFAANSGFVAKMNYNGSYLVYYLTKAIKSNVERQQGKTLAEILEDVQNKLHDHGKQQTVNTMNNHTRTLVFQKNIKDSR